MKIWMRGISQIIKVLLEEVVGILSIKPIQVMRTRFTTLLLTKAVRPDKISRSYQQVLILMVVNHIIIIVNSTVTQRSLA